MTQSALDLVSSVSLGKSSTAGQSGLVFQLRFRRQRITLWPLSDPWGSRSWESHWPEPLGRHQPPWPGLGTDCLSDSSGGDGLGALELAQEQQKYRKQWFSSSLSPPLCFIQHPRAHLQILLSAGRSPSDSDLLLLIWSRGCFLPGSFMASLVSVVCESALPPGQLGSICLGMAEEGTCVSAGCPPRASSCQEVGPVQCCGCPLTGLVE